jgi:hypothetical protein
MIVQQQLAGSVGRSEPCTRSKAPADPCVCTAGLLPGRQVPQVAGAAAELLPPLPDICAHCFCLSPTPVCQLQGYCLDGKCLKWPVLLGEFSAPHGGAPGDAATLEGLVQYINNAGDARDGRHTAITMWFFCEWARVFGGLGAFCVGGECVCGGGGAWRGAPSADITAWSCADIGLLSLLLLLLPPVSCHCCCCCRVLERQQVCAPSSVDP